jgi:hypothetical protein
MHEHYISSSRRFINIDVRITTLEARIESNKILLRAIEHTTYFYYLPAGADLPNTSEEETPHVFVFANHGFSYTTQADKPHIVKASYVQGDPGIIYDDTGGCGGPYSDPCPDPNYDDSGFCCYEEEAIYAQASTGSQPLDPYAYSVVQPRSCLYRGGTAATYAYDWAFSNNPAYRVFSNDCTNFVSHALREGGNWSFKGWQKNIKNWGHWWYDRQGSQNRGQTRTWTQAKALNYFVWHSGRGFNTIYICDLDRGDLIFFDWNNDGQIDHVGMVTTINCLWGFDGVLVTQHSPSRRNKSLSEYVRDVPNVRFYAWWICHT